MEPTPSLQDYSLVLYVSGLTVRSIEAVSKVKEICESRLKGRYCLEVVNVHEEPERLRRDQIYATPTLIRFAPQPLRRIIGDMRDTRKLMHGLDLTAEES